MRTQTLGMCGLLVGLSVLCTHQKLAAQPTQPSAVPSFEVSTLVVLSVDVGQLDISAATDWAVKIAPPGTDVASIPTAIQPVKAFLERLQAIGTDQVFVNLPAEDLLRGTPLFFAKTRDVQAFEREMNSLWKLVFPHGNSIARMHRGWVVFGSETAVNRVTQIERPMTDRFDRALASKELEHQLLLSLSLESRSDLVALWPDQAPEGFPIEFSPRQLVDDLRFLRLEVSQPPGPKAFIEMVASDSPGATLRLRELATKMIDLQPALKDYFRITENGSKIRLSLNAGYVAENLKTILTRMRNSANRSRNMNNLKQVGLALHNHYSAFEKLPDLAIRDESGEPLLSWRVKLLPFVDQVALYNNVNRENAWNAPEHEILGKTIVPTYTVSENPSTKSVIRIPVIRGSMWDKPDTPKTFREIRDGSSNTIAVAIAPPDQAIPWMNPGEWRLDEDDLIGSFFGDRESVPTLFLDASVRVLRKSEVTEEELRGMLTIAGGEILNP